MLFLRPLTILLLIVLARPLAAELRVAPADALQPSAAGYVWEPRIAASANGFLVAWIDHRPPAEDDWPMSEGHVRAMRLDANGERVDERDFEIAPLTRGNIAVASDGRDYLVAHPGIRDGRHVVRFLLVPGSRGEAPRLVNEIAGYQVDLAWAGSHYVARIDSGLHVLDRAGAAVERVNLGNLWRILLLGTRDGRLFLVHQEWAGRTTAALVTIDDVMRHRSRDDWPGAVVLSPGGGVAYGVAEGEDGFAVLMGDDGSKSWTIVLDRDARNPSTSVQLDGVYPVWGIERLGTGYAVMAQVEDQVTVIRLAADGKRLHTEPLDTNAWHLVAAPAAGGTVMLAYESGLRAIRVQRLSLDATPMLPEPGAVVSMSRVTQEEARVARCRTFDAVVWVEPDGESKRVMLRRFDRDGAALGAAVQLDVTLEPFPAVVCGRNRALVHWTHHFQGSWPSQVGVLIGAQQILPRITLEEGRHLEVVFDGESFVAASVGRPLRLIRWNEQGMQTAKREHVLLPDGLTLQYPQALGWNGEEFLLVVHLDAKLYGYRFEPDLSFAGATDRIAGAEPGPEHHYYDVEVAPSPGAWLVAWNRRRSSWRFIPATARLSREGNLLDPHGGVAIGGRIFGGMRQLSWNGAQWELVTQDGVLVRDPDGIASMLRLAGDDILLHGIAASGYSRRIVYQRIEPIDGVHELYTDIIDAQAWVEGPRRRSSRH